VDDGLYTDDLDLATVSNREELASMLRAVHVLADKPSLRILEARTRHEQVPLSKTVVSEMLRGTKFPRKGHMLAFLRACGVRDHNLTSWQRAWERLAVEDATPRSSDAVLSAGREVRPTPDTVEVAQDTETAAPPGPDATAASGLDEIRAEVRRLAADGERLRFVVTRLERQLAEKQAVKSSAGASNPTRPVEKELNGRYRLVNRLGSGSMSSLWRADDMLLERVVALKEMVGFEGHDSHQRRERARREARALARIWHPAVVPVLDAIFVNDALWIVMPYIDGRSLADILRNGPLDERKIATIGLPVLSGLRAAHNAGVVHRDIKPANIMLTKDNSVYLLDFGIAQIIGDPRLTATNMIVGTPDFLAPEKLNGDEDGPAADLWSLGVTFYSALEGKVPFRRETMAATFKAILHDDPVLTRRGKLGNIVLRLMDKQPHRRPSLDEVSYVFRSVLDGPPTP
jgi:Protein kinase domain